MVFAPFGLGVRMHPVPGGETGEARRKGPRRGGGSPGLHDQREEGGDTPPGGRSLHPCAAPGAGPLGFDGLLEGHTGPQPQNRAQQGA